MSDLRWAAPSRDDDAEWADLLAAIEAVDRHGEVYGPEDIDDEWKSVWAHPETDSMFVWDGPQLAAFAWQKTQVAEHKRHRIGLWGGVRPSHRGRGIGRELLAWQVRRATEVASRLDPTRGADINLDALDHQTDLLHLAARAGFEPVRRFLDLVRPTSQPLPTLSPTPELELRRWSDALDEPTRLAHGEAFLDHWGSEPRGVEAWKQWYTGHRGFRPDLSLVAVDPGNGEVAGFVLAAAYEADWEQGDNPVEAWINSVGTRRAWRGKGVAAWLLTEALRRIAESDTGFERAILGVDSENPTGALRLYRRLGFVAERAATTLALHLDPKAT